MPQERYHFSYATDWPAELSWLPASDHLREITAFLSKSMQSIGENNMEGLISGDERLVSGVYALMQSMLLAAWTAFESVCKDAWIIALDHGPKDWAKKVFDKGVQGATDAASKEPRKSVEIRTLGEYGYDLRTQIGTLLADEKKVDFERFKNAKEAWIAVFGKDAAAIFEDTKYALIEPLEAVRNLIAHRGGIVDETFQRRVHGVPPLKDLKIGEELPLNGRAVRVFIMSAFTCAIALIRFVDKKLSDHEHWTYSI